MVDSPAQRYVRLGLQLGRHVDGIVDAYFGPPDLAAEVDAASLVEPRALASGAGACTTSSTTAGFATRCAAFGRTPARSPETSARTSTRSEGCYGVRPHRTDEAVFASAHQQLAELLPGEGPLGERKRRWEESMQVPLDKVERTVAAVIREARELTRGLVELPDGEEVAVEIVRDEPWLAFCEYLGDFRSRISVNVDLPMSGVELLVLAMHETYPGHHTERCCKELGLVRRRGLLEETVVMVPTPQAVVAEGIATVAPHLLLEGDGGAALAAVVRREAGVEVDLDHALAVERALDPCRWANLNAALMLHDARAGESEVQAYLERWGLLTSEMAAHLIRFLEEPTSRTYMITYLAGRELTRAYVGDDPARFRCLLTEQVRVGELLAAGPDSATPP